MNLLPKSHHEFSKTDYWNTFFKKRGKKAFEWYGEFPELSSYLLKYIKPIDDILIVGCGNSKLGMDLYDANYKNITNIDVSHVVIKQMQELNKSKRPNLVFEQMDATKMLYPDGKFSVVIDKGTLDALMPNNDEATKILISKYFEEIKRVLKNSGRYICISLLQEHILRILVENFSSTFAFRVIRCHDVEIKAKEQDESPMPTFIVIATKFTKLSCPILEMALTDGPSVRLNSVEDIISNVISTQESASLCNNLHKGSVAEDGEVSFDLYVPGNVEPRYTVYILDKLAKERRSYAAFIVPQGRETDWLFSSTEGRQQVLKSTQYDRLAIVILRRGQIFESLEAVKNEIGDSIKNFTPSQFVKSQITFFSIGTDIGKRNICYQGKSDISGSFVVEEIETEDGLYRRLIFMNNQFVVQSEVKLKQVTSRRKKLKFVVDPNFIACDHHLYIALGLKAALKKQNISETIIIGLGGGGLCTFIRQYIPEARIIAVEIDEIILKVAKEYFDLIQDEKLRVKIADGREYLINSAAQGLKYNVIIFDVDSKDTSVGMSCPPQQFLEPDFLKTIYDCLLEDGYFILNIVARNEKLRDKSIDNLKKIFKFCVSYKLLGDVNEIIFCAKNENNFTNWKNIIQESAVYMNEQSKIKNPHESKELFEIESLLSNLKIANNS